MLVTDFHYDLPEDLIAQTPPVIRGTSRMMTLDRRTGAFADHTFPELSQLLHPGDLLILNDTRVLPARLYATRAGLTTQHNSPTPTGHIEVLLTQHLPNPEGHNDWTALVRPAKKIQPGETLTFAGPTPTLSGPTQTLSDPTQTLSGPTQTLSDPTQTLSGPTQTLSDPTQTLSGPTQTLSSRPKSAHFADVVERSASPAGAPDLSSLEIGEVAAPLLTAEVLTAGDFGERTLRFAPTEDFHAILDRIGHLPLPPYIHREKSTPNTPEDRSRYQTVFANERGSAAAPTAGLHFTPEILQQLSAHKVEIAHITLHVGLGTFQPVRVSRTEDIKLHAEPYTLSQQTAEAINKAKREGRRIIAVGTTTTRTLEHIARESERTGNPISAHSSTTGLFLSPRLNDDFKLVSGLLTNFHLPESTLLMLVSAFAGREATLRAYAHAVATRYRFFSYGDCMLIL